MRIEVVIWTISELIKIMDKIDEQPPYQRGEVWPRSKKKHLIDSLLRGIDIPKIYLRKVDRGPYEYEVADGQQRVTSILDYINNQIKLDSGTVSGLNLAEVHGYAVGGKKFSELDSTLQERLLNYKLTMAIVNNATNNEIRTLFGRLQLGSTLNPAEKRNAVISTVGDQINNFALNHTFFGNGSIMLNAKEKLIDE